MPLPQIFQAIPICSMTETRNEKVFNSDHIFQILKCKTQVRRKNKKFGHDAQISRMSCFRQADAEYIGFRYMTVLVSQVKHIRKVEKMKMIKNIAERFMHEEDGAQVVEYALIIAVLSIALVLVLGNSTTGIAAQFNAFVTKVGTCLSTGTC